MTAPEKLTERLASLKPSAGEPRQSTLAILELARPLQNKMSVGEAADLLQISPQRLHAFAHRYGLKFLKGRRRGKRIVNNRRIALPHDMAKWLLAQVPPGCDAVDVIIAIITDAYNEEKDK